MRAPVLAGVQVESHTDCIKQVNYRKHIQNNELRSQTMALAKCIHSYDTGNERLFFQWSQQEFYLIQQVAARNSEIGSINQYR